jgi:hypothetical protein
MTDVAVAQPDGWSLKTWLRTSSVPYLAMTVVAILAARYTSYLFREDIQIKGQPLYIAVELIIFPLAVLLWLYYRGKRTTSRWLTVFLVAMLVAWAVRLGLMVIHGDLFNHLAWLTPVFLIMLLLKTPSWQDAWTGVVVLAGGLAVILVSAYLLEVSGLIEPLYLPAGITEFQQKEYWLPLDGFLGVDGRWTGPFGHNTRAGFAAALIFVIGFAQWRRSSIPLVVIGTFFLLITSVRASYLAAFTGVLILILFSRWRGLARVPLWARWAALGLFACVATYGFTMTGAGLTGRQSIWPAFWALYPDSPIIGVGRQGIMAAGGLTAVREDAHNILLDELVRFGIIGFVVMIGALLIGLIISFRAAARGFAAGAAVVVAYLVTSMTDIQNDWIQLYYHSFLILMAVTAAGAWVEARKTERLNEVQSSDEAVT